MQPLIKTILLAILSVNAVSGWVLIALYSKLEKELYGAFKDVNSSPAKWSTLARRMLGLDGNENYAKEEIEKMLVKLERNFLFSVLYAILVTVMAVAIFLFSKIY